MIISNQAKCLRCGDEPFSGSVHDLRYCECRSIYVDGGMEYKRHGFKKWDEYMDLSIEMTELEVEMCLSALDWADDNGRNNLGRVCAMMRALRDSGFLDKVMG